MLFELKLALHFLLVLVHIIIAPLAHGASEPDQVFRTLCLCHV